MPDVLKYWDYDYLKYNCKRDPTIDEVVSAASSYLPSIGKEMNEACDYWANNKNDLP